MTRGTRNYQDPNGYLPFSSSISSSCTSITSSACFVAKLSRWYPFQGEGPLIMPVAIRASRPPRQEESILWTCFLPSRWNSKTSSAVQVSHSATRRVLTTLTNFSNSSRMILSDGLYSPTVSIAIWNYPVELRTRSEAGSIGIMNWARVVS